MSASITEYSSNSASQMLQQIHQLKSDLYDSHLRIQDLQKENKDLKEKMKPTKT